jgi:hypothetical protein
MFHTFCTAEIQTAAESFKRTFQIYASGGGHQHVYVLFCTRHTEDTLKLTLSLLDISDDDDDDDDDDDYDDDDDDDGDGDDDRDGDQAYFPSFALCNMHEYSAQNKPFLFSTRH